MSSLFDNNLTQLALLLLAFYVILQIMRSDSSSENMEATTFSPVTPAPLQIPFQQVNTPSIPQVMQPIPSSTSSEVYASAPSAGQVVPSMSTMAPIASFAMQPPVIQSPGQMQLTPEMATPNYSSNPTYEFNPLMTAEDSNAPWTETPTGIAMAPLGYGHPGDQISPQELIPPPMNNDLYGDLQPDANLAQNFLQNRWSLGIDVSKPKRGYVNDLRGVQYVVPYKVVSPFNQPSEFPDFYRKSLADIS